MRIIYLFFALFFFNFVISFICSSTQTITGFTKSIIFGGMAGFAGNFAWIAITEYHQFETLNDFFLHDWYRVMNGVKIGLFCALAIHLYRYYVGNRVKSTVMKYIQASLIGGTFVFVQHLFLNGIDDGLKFFILGLLVTIDSAFVSGVFEVNEINGEIKNR